MATLIKTPTRTVTISMTGVTDDGYDDKIDYSTDYIGGLVDENLGQFVAVGPSGVWIGGPTDDRAAAEGRCQDAAREAGDDGEDYEVLDATEIGHQYFAADETADWWDKHCAAQEEADNALAQLSSADRETVTNSLGNHDVEDMPGAIMTAIEELTAE